MHIAIIIMCLQVEKISTLAIDHYIQTITNGLLSNLICIQIQSNIYTDNHDIIKRGSKITTVHTGYNWDTFLTL